MWRPGSGVTTNDTIPHGSEAARSAQQAPCPKPSQGLVAGQLRLPRRSLRVPRLLGLQGPGDHLSQVQRLPAPQLGYLLTTAEAVGDDYGLGRRLSYGR
jgi:hypothetical protein